MPRNTNGLALQRKHQKKIALLKPHLIDAVHTLLKSHGVDAVVHSISFRASGPVPRAAAGLGGGQCPGGAPCCIINGVWTCPG
jgi:hypothetical protein